MQLPAEELSVLLLAVLPPAVLLPAVLLLAAQLPELLPADLLLFRLLAVSDLQPVSVLLPAVLPPAAVKLPVQQDMQAMLHLPLP